MCPNAFQFLFKFPSLGSRVHKSPTNECEKTALLNILLRLNRFPEANPSFVPAPDALFDDEALEETEKNKRKQMKVLTRTGSALSELVEAK